MAFVTFHPASHSEILFFRLKEFCSDENSVDEEDTDNVSSVALFGNMPFLRLFIDVCSFAKRRISGDSC